MKTNIKLLALSKNEHRSMYTLPKEQKIFAIIRNILYKIKFQDDSLDQIRGFGRPYNEKTEHVELDKEEDVFPRDYNERIINISNKDYSIDIIFFSKKVILIFNYKKDKQQEISKAFEDFISEEN